MAAFSLSRKCIIGRARGSRKRWHEAHEAGLVSMATWSELRQALRRELTEYDFDEFPSLDGREAAVLLPAKIDAYYVEVKGASDGVYGSGILVGEGRLVSFTARPELFHSDSYPMDNVVRVIVSTTPRDRRATPSSPFAAITVRIVIRGQSGDLRLTAGQHPKKVHELLALVRKLHEVMGRRRRQGAG